MRICVLSDIHSNYDALAAVLADVEREKVDAYWCLGDVVGYGAEPDKVVDAMRALGGVTVAGNHDWAACGKVTTRNFNRHAAKAAEWTGRTMRPENLAWLADLPLVARENGALLVHATPSAPEEWHYCMQVEDAWTEMEAFTEPLCLIGHSHFPGAFERDDEDIRYTRAGELVLRPGRQYLVNVGSVGQPRDNDPRAAWLLYDQAKGRLRHMRVDYDVRAAQEKILAAGLPQFLAARLAAGD